MRFPVHAESRVPSKGPQLLSTQYQIDERWTNNHPRYNEKPMQLSISLDGRVTQLQSVRTTELAGSKICPAGSQDRRATLTASSSLDHRWNLVDISPAAIPFRQDQTDPVAKVDGGARPYTWDHSIQLDRCRSAISPVAPWYQFCNPTQCWSRQCPVIHGSLVVCIAPDPSQLLAATEVVPNEKRNQTASVLRCEFGCWRCRSVQRVAVDRGAVTMVREVFAALYASYQRENQQNGRFHATLNASDGI